MLVLRIQHHSLMVANNKLKKPVIRGNHYMTLVTTLTTTTAKINVSEAWPKWWPCFMPPPPLRSPTWNLGMVSSSLLILLI